MVSPLKEAQQAHTESPAVDAEEVDVSVSDQILETVCRAFYVGVAGDVKVTMMKGTEVTFPGMQVGVLYPFRITKVFNVGTTASGIVALY